MNKVEVIKPFVGLGKYPKWKSGWSDQDGINIYSYISYVCDPEDVLVVSRLFFPDLVCVDGCVFLEFKYNPGMVGLLSSYGDREKMDVELSVNRVSLYDAFFGASDKVGDLIYEQLCEVLAVSWSMALGKAFPGVEFKIESSNLSSDYGPSLTFCKLR